jgi:hypothetical protein
MNYPNHPEFVLSRVVKLGSAIGTDRKWVGTTDPEEAIKLYRQGWEFEEGLCVEPCAICAAIFDAIEHKQG